MASPPAITAGCHVLAKAGTGDAAAKRSCATTAPANTHNFALQTLRNVCKAAGNVLEGLSTFGIKTAALAPSGTNVHWQGAS